jgi:hypothetical protein
MPWLPHSNQVELTRKPTSIDESYQTISDQITALETKLVDINNSWNVSEPALALSKKNPELVHGFSRTMNR